MDNYEEWYTFYVTERGHHPRSTGGFNEISPFSINNFPVTYHIDKISPRPILFITGDIAHSKSFSETAYNKAKQYIENSNNYDAALSEFLSEELEDED